MKGRESARSALAFMSLALLISGCSQDQTSSPRRPAPLASFEGTQEYYFETLPRMVATVDLVVMGTVEEVRAGRSVAAEGDEFPVEFVDSVVRVSQVLKGNQPPGPLTVETLKFETYESEWRKAGQEILIFLIQGDAQSDGKHYPANSQSVLLLNGEDVRAAIDDPFVTRLARMSLGKLAEDIGRAKEMIERGEVEPVPRFGSG